MEAQLRLHVRRAAESAVRHGHPWVFSESVREENRVGRLGEIAAIFGTRDQFVGLGLYDPESLLRVRMLHVGAPVRLERGWWLERLGRALRRREGMFDSGTTGYRCIHGENDGWPGLVLDRYGSTYVLKLYTGAWFPRLEELTGWLDEVVHPERLILRLSRNVQKTAASFGHADGQLLRGGPAAEGRVPFRENGLVFEADVVAGQKTGFFLDQRENRQRVRELAAGREVLNAFSYTGGFSVYAAAGGAQSVTDLDISSYALAGSQRHFALNGNLAEVRQCRWQGIQADAFEWLQVEKKRSFDLVVLDPPSLAKKEQERARAIAAYERLAESGLRRLRPGGILVAASCSAHVSAPEFFGAVRKAAERSGRAMREMGTTGHPADHPAGFKEAEYLKCIYLEERFFFRRSR